MKTVEERVQAGINWLNVYERGWLDKASLPRLNMKSACDCVFGQLCNGEFWKVIPFSPEEATDHGFWERQEDDYKPLQIEWTKRIKELKDASQGNLRQG